MPLYNYKCPDCEYIIEKFQYKPSDVIEIICERCGSQCEKQLPFAYSRVWLDAKSMYDNKIAPDAKRIMDNMANGKDGDFIDIYGDK